MMLGQPWDGDLPEVSSPRPSNIVLSPAEEIIEDTEPDARAFYTFERHVIDLDKALRKLSNEARQLGSSIGILSATFSLCERLARIHFLFRQNAAALFPGKISARSELSVERYWNFKRQRKHLRARNRFLSIVARITSKEQPQPQDLPLELTLFAKDLATLLDCFSSFQDFVEEVPEQSLEADLRWWAELLKGFQGDIATPAIRRYIHDLSIPLGLRLKRIRDFIPTFTEVGIKTIRGAQKHSAGNLYNLSTVATLFSGVTAAMIQFSYQNTGSLKANVVNGFWFTSLVFSISAAVNSLLGLTWMQAIYRSPDQRVPWWVLIWIKRSPLGFLVLSVACFFIGLVSFVYSSQQHIVVCVIIAVLSAMCCFGLAALSLWFAFERWIFDWHDGHKLLSDAIKDLRLNFLSAPPIAWSTSRVQGGFALSRRLCDFLWSITQSMKAPWSVRSSTSQGSAPSDIEAQADMVEIHPMARRFTASSSESTIENIPPLQLKGVERFKYIVNGIIIANRIKRVDGSTANTPPSPEMIKRATRRQITEASDLAPTVPSAKVNALVPKLRTLAPTIQLDAHNALVKDVQFSPDGKLLATASWDKKTLLLNAMNGFEIHQMLPYRTGFISQVEWSPNGAYLMTKLNNTIKLWPRSGSSGTMKSFVRSRPIQSVQWLPNSQGILSVEGNGAAKLDLDGTVKLRYTVENMEMSDVAVTKDMHWMVCVGSLTSEARSTTSGDRSGMSQIILYDMKTVTIAKRVPVFHDASDVDIASDDRSVLISFNDAKVPSQLWTLELKDTPTITLRHTYVSSVVSPGKMVPPASRFGGEDDHLVLRAETAGDILIWDRDSANLLHHIRPPPGIGRLSSFAWNSAIKDSFMFATGSHDGAIRIWTLPSNGTPQRETPPSSRALYAQTLVGSPTSEHVSSPKPRSQRLPSSGSFGFGPRSESPDHHAEQGGDEEWEDDSPAPLRPALRPTFGQTPLPTLTRKRRATTTA